uniref:C3H1-type domain-containing protein n=1 Tax=Globodera rostochiensis TaxID=31243 RepID=A0A914I8E5_GLORO
MAGTHEQTGKMGRKCVDDVEDGELPEEGEIMEDEEEQHTGSNSTTTAAEKSSRAMPQQQGQQHPSLNKTGGGGKDSRGGGGSSWRRSFGGRGHFEHSYGGGKPHFSSRAGGRYRDYDSRAAMKSEEAMMDSWVRGTHRNKGARSPISPLRTTSGSPCADQPKQKQQNAGKREAVADEESNHQQQQKTDHETEEGAKESSDESAVTANTTNSETLQQQQQPIPMEDDKDYRVETPPATELLVASKPFDLIENDDDNDFRRHSFGRFSEKRSFRANVPQLSPQNAASLSPKTKHGQPQKDIQSTNAPPHERDDDFGPTPKRHRPAFFDEENFPIGGGGDYRQQQQEFDPSFEQGLYEQHEDPHEEHWGGGRGRGGGFHHFRGSRGGMHRPEWGGGPRWSGGGGPGNGKPFFDRIICKFFREGFCRDGDKCTYSHATADSHRQPVLCRYYQQGFCRRNLFCQNLHGEWPCKAFQKGECTKEQCMFSHEPLDDVSRPILEKMLEDERRGIPDGQNLEPQFQGGYYQRRKMFHQMREQQFHHHQQWSQQQQYNDVGDQNFHSPHHQQQYGGERHETLNNGGPPPELGRGATHPSPQHQQQHQAVQQTQHPTQSAAYGGHSMAQAQHPMEPFDSPAGGPTGLPPPALVVPPMLGGGVPQPQPVSGGPLHQPIAVVAAAHPQHPPPPAADSTSFGFFNRSAPLPGAPPPNQAAPPSQQGPLLQQNLCMMTPPQSNFQQLQQQAQHIPTGPHFPHQPSLLGPSNTTGPLLNAMLQQQQQFGTPVKSEPFGDVLQQITPTPPRPPSPARGQSGAFNINQMLEQITQQSEQFKTPKMEDPMDLLSKAVEESPASPPMFGSCSELASGTSADEAKLIPTVREWRLYAVDIPAETEGLPMNFDMKLIQQISSSNSDPRLRKLAEKQFDLVSKTFEKKQQQQQCIAELTGDNVKKETTTADSVVSATNDGTAVNKARKGSTTAADPRKDPRRKGRTTEQNQPPPSTSSSSSTVSSPHAVATPSVSVAVPFQIEPLPSASTTAGIFSVQQQVSVSTASGSAGLAETELVERQLRMQIGEGTQPHSQYQPADGAKTTATKTMFGRPAEGMGKLADEQFQHPFAYPAGGGPFFGLHHHQQSPAPFFHQNASSMDQSENGVPSQPPPFMAHLHPPPYGHQLHSSPAVGGASFCVPPPVLPMTGSGPVAPNAAASLQQQLGAHAFGVGGFSSTSSDSVGGPLRAPPQQSSQISSLREKRKNNEYESPLARIASSSGASGSGGVGGGCSGRRGSRY